VKSVHIPRLFLETILRYLCLHSLRGKLHNFRTNAGREMFDEIN
jgi:hypothetical protein